MKHLDERLSRLRTYWYNRQLEIINEDPQLLYKGKTLDFAIKKIKNFVHHRQTRISYLKKIIAYGQLDLSNFGNDPKQAEKELLSLL